MADRPTCELCGKPMPEGEEMFRYHGYSGPCPRTPMHHLRFRVPDPDPRPVLWPLPAGCCYWVTGEDAKERSTVVAYLPVDKLKEYWPDAEEVDDQGEVDRPVFTDRFPKPAWFVEEN